MIPDTAVRIFQIIPVIHALIHDVSNALDKKAHIRGMPAKNHAALASTVASAFFASQSWVL